MLLERNDEQACQKEARNVALSRQTLFFCSQTTSDFHETRTNEPDPFRKFGSSVNHFFILYSRKDGAGSATTLRKEIEAKNLPIW